MGWQCRCNKMLTCFDNDSSMCNYIKWVHFEIWILLNAAAYVANANVPRRTSAVKPLEPVAMVVPGVATGAQVEVDAVETLPSSAANTSHAHPATLVWMLDPLTRKTHHFQKVKVWTSRICGSHVPSRETTCSGSHSLLAVFQSSQYEK